MFSLDPGTVILSLLLLLLLILFVNCLKKRNLDIPGPRGWPYIGNAFQIDQKYPFLTWTNWAKEYGPLYAVNLFGKRCIVASGEESIYEVLVHKSQDFAGRDSGFRATCAKNHLATAVGDFSKSWQERKKLLSKTLRMYGDGLKHLEDISINIIDDLIQVWKSKSDVAFNPEDDIHNTLLNIMFSLIFGYKIPWGSDLEKEILKSYKLESEIFDPSRWAELDLFPWLQYLGHPLMKKFKKYDHFLHVTLQGIINDARKNTDPNNPKCIVDSLEIYMSKQRNQEDKDVLSEENMAVTLSELVSAGTKTTLSTLLSFIGQCVIHQVFQDRLRACITEKIGERQAVLEDRPNLPLVEATILEMLRLTSVAPVCIPHEATTDSSIAGFFIPKGTQVLPNVWCLHHDEKYWADPWHFKPDRFLDAEGNLVLPDHPHRKRMLAFSAGIRVCLGEVLAKNRLFLLVTTLIQRFKFLPTDILPNIDPRCQITGMVLNPPPFTVKVEPLF